MPAARRVTKQRTEQRAAADRISSIRLGSKRAQRRMIPGRSVTPTDLHETMRVVDSLPSHSLHCAVPKDWKKSFAKMREVRQISYSSLTFHSILRQRHHYYTANQTR